MKKREAAGCSGLPIDLIKHLGESGVDMVHEILKRSSLGRGTDARRV